MRHLPLVGVTQVTLPARSSSVEAFWRSGRQSIDRVCEALSKRCRSRRRVRFSSRSSCRIHACRYSTKSDGQKGQGRLVSRRPTDGFPSHCGQTPRHPLGPFLAVQCPSPPMFASVCARRSATNPSLTPCSRERTWETTLAPQKPPTVPDGLRCFRFEPCRPQNSARASWPAAGSMRMSCWATHMVRVADSSTNRVRLDRDHRG